MPLPARLCWRHTQRRTAWLFNGTTCLGSLGFGGYGRASGLTTRGVWHLHRLGVLHQGVTVAPADTRQPPLLLQQSSGLDGTLALDGEIVRWRHAGLDAWCFERERDRLCYFRFTASGLLQAETDVEVCPGAATLEDPSPLLLLGAFLVRLAVDDTVVIAGG